MDAAYSGTYHKSKLAAVTSCGNFRLEGEGDVGEFCFPGAGAVVHLGPGDLVFARKDLRV